MTEAQKYTFLAMLERDEQKQGEFIEKIIKENEKIEQLYSLNWH